MSKILCPLPKEGYLITFDSNSFMIDERVGNQYISRGHFPTLLSLFQTLLFDTKNKLRMKMENKYIPIMEDIIDLIKNRRKSEENDWSNVYKLQKSNDKYNPLNIIVPKIKKEYYVCFPNEKTLDRFIFNTKIKLQRFNNLDELREYLEMEWL